MVLGPGGGGLGELRFPGIQQGPRYHGRITFQSIVTAFLLDPLQGRWADDGG